MLGEMGSVLTVAVIAVAIVLILMPLMRSLYDKLRDENKHDLSGIQLVRKLSIDKDPEIRELMRNLKNTIPNHRALERIINRELRNTGGDKKQSLRNAKHEIDKDHGREASV